MRPLLFSVVVVCIAVASGAFAQTFPVGNWQIAQPEKHDTSSFYGSTGLVFTPTAMIAPPMKLSGGWHTLDLDTGDQTVYNANVGITADIEFGVARLQDIQIPGILTQGTTDETVFNAKYNVDLSKWTGVVDGPELAIGGWDLSDELNRAIYIVLSKDMAIQDEGLLSNFKLHIGFGDTEISGGALDGLFGGIEFSPFESALVQVEYDSEDFNAALRYYPTEWMSLDVGIIDSDFAYGISARSTF